MPVRNLTGGVFHLIGVRNETQRLRLPSLCRGFAAQPAAVGRAATQRTVVGGTGESRIEVLTGTRSSGLARFSTDSVPCLLHADDAMAEVG